MAKGSGFDLEVEKELERRCDIISDPSYEYVPFMNKKDWIYIVVFMVVCLALLAYGVS
jgi:hypothetical protein